MASISPHSFGTNILNNIYNQQELTSSPFQQSRFPWQQDNVYVPGSLWQLLQSNNQQLQQPFSVQPDQNSNADIDTQWLPWQQNNSIYYTDIDYQQLEKENQDQYLNYIGQEWQKQSGSNSPINKNMEDIYEQIVETQKEMVEAEKKEASETFEAYMLYVLMLLLYTMYDHPIATYFLGTKLLSFVMTKYGFSNEQNLFFILFVQCIDVIALIQGRFKFLDGYQQRWYQKLFDYIMSALDMPYIVRYGPQIFMPHGYGPNYSQMG